MHTKNPKKAYPSQSSCNPLDAIIVSHVHKTTLPLPKFRAAKPTQQIASSSEASPTFGHANANLNDYHYSFQSLEIGSLYHRDYKRIEGAL